ncbi:MAG TPA: hypothetical protein ENH80_02410, partial [Phycisphaerae bacterium]|nr:hypothetical protein [Phycisphaerae bacterium]
MVRVKTLGVLVLVGLTAIGGCKRKLPTPPAAEAPQQSTQPAAPIPPPTQAAPGAAGYHAAIDAAHQATARRLIEGGVDYLLARRDSDGAWSVGDGRMLQPALTAMAIKALVQDPRFTHTSPEVRTALDVLLRYRQDDGGIYDPDQGMASYTTSVAVM